MWLFLWAEYSQQNLFELGPFYEIRPIFNIILAFFSFNTATNLGVWLVRRES